MGAFFLYHSNKQLDLTNVSETFSRKGFAQPLRRRLGDWTLWLYRKQMIDVDNFFEADDGTLIVAVGTPVYRGRSYSDTLRCLLFDFQRGMIDQSQLCGSFCVLFWNGRFISALTDRLNTLHVFFDEHKTVLSNSFLAILSGSPYPRPLNRLAACEKLSTGYIVSPDTLVDGIFQVDDLCYSKWSAEKDLLTWIPHPTYSVGDLHAHGSGESLERQQTVLHEHFRLLNSINTEFHGELGLSDGFDSRLVLACSQFLDSPISAHTHATKDGHDQSKSIVEQIAQTHNINLVEVPTSQIEEHTPDSVAKIMEDNLYYYDGRCSHNMGAFSEVYTAEYRRKVIGSNRFSLNGLGGEIYRNYYYTNQGTVPLDDWMRSKVYYYFASDAVGDSALYKAMHQHRMGKIFARIGAPSVARRVDFLWRRRYYSEVRMPDCDANNNDAHNQLSFFHTPFMDARVVIEGLRATPYIGATGVYQAALINLINPSLASLPSHYGYQFSKVPRGDILLAWVKGQVPDKWLYYRNKMKDRKLALPGLPRFLSFLETTPCLVEIRDALLASGTIHDFNIAMLNYAQRPTTFSVGMFFKSFHHKIRWD